MYNPSLNTFYPNLFIPSNSINNYLILVWIYLYYNIKDLNPSILIQ